MEYDKAVGADLAVDDAVHRNRAVTHLAVRDVHPAVHGVVLVEARKEKRFGQESLSKILGQGRNYIQKIEYKERRMDVVEFLQIAQALEIDPVELFKRFVKIADA